MNELISTHLTEIINFLILVISGGFWMDARKKRAEVKSSEADATQKIVELYQSAIDDLEKRYKQRYTELDSFYKDRLKNLETSLREEIKKEFDKKYGAKLIELENEIKSLRTNLELWKTKYRNLKQAFDDYRAKTKKQ